MSKKRQASRKRPFRREILANWLSGILVAMYVVTFFVSLVASWMLPNNTTLITILERWLAALTPLIAIIAHRYLRQRSQQNDKPGQPD